MSYFQLSGFTISLLTVLFALGKTSSAEKFLHYKFRENKTYNKRKLKIIFIVIYISQAANFSVRKLII